MAAVVLVLASCGKKQEGTGEKGTGASELDKTIAEAAEKLPELPSAVSENKNGTTGDSLTADEPSDSKSESDLNQGSEKPVLADETEGRVGEVELDDGVDYPLYYYEGLCYVLKDGEASVINTVLSDDTLEEYVIRDYIEEAGTEYPVTKLDAGSFDSFAAAKSITIPESVKAIGDECFYGCDELTSIVIPDSVTDIGESIFAECRSLKNVKLPKNVESFGEGIFFNCDQLEACELPYNLTIVPKETFSGCTSITDIAIPVTVKTIGVDAFWSCESLEKLCLPQGITVIEDGAFFDCCSLKELCLPPALESFEPDFDYCDELTMVCTSKTFYDKLAAYFEGTSVEVGNIDDPDSPCASNCSCDTCL